MNVKYANKVVVVKEFEIPAGEFDYQVKPIKFSVGSVLWKYNGKYNKVSSDYSEAGFVWNSQDRWNGGYLIPSEFVEFLSEKS